MYNILSKRKVKDFVLLNKQSAARMLKCYYFDTYSFIEKTFTSSYKFSEKLYKYVYGENVGYCIWCNKNPTKFRSFNEGYLRFCSQSCQQKSTASKYGVDNLFQSEIIKRRIKNTLKRKYGVDNPNKSDVCVKKSKSTKLNKYGDENYNNQEKSRLTCLEKYGVPSVNQCPEILQKQQDSAFLTKIYKFPSGKKLKCQGYEPLALDILSKHYNEDDILTSKKDVPEIWYKLNNEDHRYFPDIFIKSNNLIVEVKSVYTFESKIEESLTKHDASKKSGFNHEIWIFDTKKKLVKKII